MGVIFMRVLNQPLAVETLLYTFKNQMFLGKKSLTLTLKHRDGFRDWYRGTVDQIFKGQLMKDVEYGDLILLEHRDDYANGFVHYTGKMDMEVLGDMAEGMKNTCHFMIPKGHPSAYFVIKDYPMASYTIFKNEVISDKALEKNAKTLNNMCGKIDHLRGIYAVLTINR